MAFSAIISFVRCRWEAVIIDPVAAAAAGYVPGMPPPEVTAVAHSDTEIICLAPAARAGAAPRLNVTLSLNSADFDSTGLQFLYYDIPAVSTITPSGGHRTGGTMVTIQGAGFDVLEGGAYVSCQFGSSFNAAYNERFTITTPIVVTSATVVCSAPSTKVTDTRELWLALNGFALGSGRDPSPTGQNYTFYNPPSVLSVLPQAGDFSGEPVESNLHVGRDARGA